MKVILGIIGVVFFLVFTGCSQDKPWELKTQRDIQKAVRKLKDKNPDIRKEGADDMGGIYYTAEAMEEPLIAALQDSEPKVRAAAAYALRKRPYQAREPLIAALKDQDPLVREKVIGTLGLINDPRVVESLIAALNDTSPSVREKAASALGNIKNPQAVPALIAALKDETVRQQAIIALGYIEDPRAAEPLLAYVRDKDYWIRSAVVRFFGEVKDPRAIAPLIDALADQNKVSPDPEVQALSKIGPPAIAPLMVALKSKKPIVRDRAARALGKMGSASLTPLLAALHDKAPEVREAAAEALVIQGISGNEKVLIATLNARGTRGMAGVFLNSGNPQLEKTAREWAKKHGYFVTTPPGAYAPVSD
jgi:HEAT repeat protein